MYSSVDEHFGCLQVLLFRRFLYISSGTQLQEFVCFSPGIYAFQGSNKDFLRDIWAQVILMNQFVDTKFHMYPFLKLVMPEACDRNFLLALLAHLPLQSSISALNQEGIPLTCMESYQGNVPIEKLSMEQKDNLKYMQLQCQETLLLMQTLSISSRAAFPIKCNFYV